MHSACACSLCSSDSSGHTYLTALAIATGIFFRGLEAAIAAPVLLCCLVVGANVLTIIACVSEREDSSNLNACVWVSVRGESRDADSKRGEREAASVCDSRYSGLCYLSRNRLRFAWLLPCG